MNHTWRMPVRCVRYLLLIAMLMPLLASEPAEAEITDHWGSPPAAMCAGEVTGFALNHRSKGGGTVSVTFTPGDGQRAVTRPPVAPASPLIVTVVYPRTGGFRWTITVKDNGDGHVLTREGVVRVISCNGGDPCRDTAVNITSKSVDTSSPGIDSRVDFSVQIAANPLCLRERRVVVDFGDGLTTEIVIAAGAAGGAYAIYHIYQYLDGATRVPNSSPPLVEAGGWGVVAYPVVVDAAATAVATGAAGTAIVAHAC